MNCRLCWLVRLLSQLANISCQLSLFFIDIFFLDMIVVYEVYSLINYPIWGLW